MKQYDVDELKRVAADKWAEVFSTLGGVSLDLLDGKHHPCPKCGGKDRFRMIDKERGALFCNGCFGTRNGDGVAALMWLRGWDFKTAVAELSRHLGLSPNGKANSKTNGKANRRPRVVATYAYCNEAGELLYQVVRREPGKDGAEKGFQQRRPNGKGGWTWSVEGIRQIPYQLPKLCAADRRRTVFIAEGEKDVDRLVKLGLVATTNAGGAGKWRPEYGEHFGQGRQVVILPDNDDRGREHAQEVARNLHDFGVSVRIVELPGINEKGDVSDWLDSGGTLEELKTLVMAAPDWKPAKRSKKRAAKKLLPQFLPFPVEVLPEPIESYINEGARALRCDASYVALPLLSALAAAVGNTRRIQLKRSWSEPCVIWTVCVGESGTLKSPAFDLALGPVRELQSTAIREWQEATEQYQTDKTIYDADLAEWKKKGRRNGEPPPDEPEAPLAVRYTCEDTTVEALAVLLQGQPRGLLMARDELSGWVNSFDAYKSCRGADVAHWLSMHRAGSLVVDRKSGRNLIHVPHAAVCIAGGVQPNALMAALGGRHQSSEIDELMDKPDREHFDNGLAARLLFAMPPRRPKQWTEDDLREETEIAMEGLFEKLLALDFDRTGEEPAPVDLPLTAEAMAVWVQFYNEHAQETSEMPGDLAAAWSKLEGYAARFALLVHLVRSAAGSPMADHAAVDAASVTAGIELSRWFGEETGRVYKILGADREATEDRERRELLRIIRKHGGSITARGLMQASRRYRASGEVAEAALMRQVNADILDANLDQHGSRGGRPVVVFSLKNDGNGNATSKDTEENEVVLPLPAEGESKSEVVEWAG